MDAVRDAEVEELERALEIAWRCHVGQRDKGGMPYVLHVAEVVLGCRGDLRAMTVAALHDSLEDGGIGRPDLEAAGFGPAVLAAVEALTRREGEAWEAYLRRVEADPLAVRVKRADLASNLDVRRLPGVDATAAARLERYRKAWKRLGG